MVWLSIPVRFTCAQCACLVWSRPADPSVQWGLLFAQRDADALTWDSSASCAKPCIITSANSVLLGSFLEPLLFGCGSNFFRARVTVVLVFASLYQGAIFGAIV